MENKNHGEATFMQLSRVLGVAGTFDADVSIARLALHSQNGHGMQGVQHGAPHTGRCGEWGGARCLLCPTAAASAPPQAEG